MSGKHWLWLVFTVAIIFMGTLRALAVPDPKIILENIERGEKQHVLTGEIDSLLIKRGAAEFRLGAGTLTLYDFGSGRIVAMTFEGKGHFRYLPPDLVELGQVKKFTGQDTLDDAFSKATFFITVEPEATPDTTRFTGSTVSPESWEQLKKARSDEFDHTKVNIASRMMGDLLSDGPGTFFNAVFELQKKGEFVFIEDPLEDDIYNLRKLIRSAGSETYDVVSSYSPENDLPSQRGVLPIDITHYDIDARIEGGGKMMVKCQVHFTPLRWGQHYIYFPWYYKNEITSVLDSNNDSLFVVHRLDKTNLFSYKTDEPGFGIVLNKPLELGVSDSLEINYECKSLENRWGVFYVTSTGQSFWYPQNAIADKATFDMTFNCPDDYEVVASGNLLESRKEGDRLITKWKETRPICYSSFNIGAFENQNFYDDKHLPVKVYLAENIPHDELALYLASLGELSSANMMNRVGADVVNSLSYYTSLFGPCPFDTIKVIEIPEAFGLGTAGVVHLSWSTFQMEQRGYDSMFRAHEVAHQWWPHVASCESYRDFWLMEGLAEYCGFWFYQASSHNNKGCHQILDYWKQDIFSGSGVNSVGSKAGPIILGNRLNSSKSNDYQTIIYTKGAYVFHMLRYMMHDFKTGSDDAFASLLQEMATKYKGRTITTQKFRTLVEEKVGGDMEWFFKQWVYGTDIPEYQFSYNATETAESKYQVTCHIKQEKVSSDFQMIVPLTVYFKDDKFVILKVLVDQPEMDVELPLLPYEPKKIVFNSFDAVLAKVDYK